METVKTRRELKKQTAKYVYVINDRTLYENHDGDWIRKEYFTVQEAMAILDRGYFCIHRMLVKFKMRPTLSKSKIKINLNQLRKMAENIKSI